MFSSELSETQPKAERSNPASTCLPALCCGSALYRWPAGVVALADVVIVGQAISGAYTAMHLGAVLLMLGPRQAL